MLVVYILFKASYKSFRGLQKTVFFNNKTTSVLGMQIMCHVGQTNLKRIQITPRIRIKIYGSHKMLYHVGFEPIVARLCCRETSKFTCVFEINFIGILFTAKIHSSVILSVNFTELMRLPEMY